MENIILKERELKNKIADDINESKLPAILLKPILREFLEQLELLEQQEYAIAYQNAQKAKEQAKKQGGDKKGK